MNKIQVVMRPDINMLSLSEINRFRVPTEHKIHELIIAIILQISKSSFQFQ